jgi:hypothetical protein
LRSNYNKSEALNCKQRIIELINMVKEYMAGEVFCAVCFKKLTDPDEIERGFHRHCKGKNGLTDDEMSSIFCSNETKQIEKHRNNTNERV